MTVSRNLDKLVEAGLARLASRDGGVGRFEAAGSPEHARHTHPHFVCTDCGTVSCLPEQPVPTLEAGPRWSQSLAAATLELKGHCPDGATDGPPQAQTRSPPGCLARILCKPSRPCPSTG
ncbi:transcriptional repressor [Myxococcota bacterium]|nr:transcriptional repressor [Myxococcota bacterium]